MRQAEHMLFESRKFMLNTARRFRCLRLPAGHPVALAARQVAQRIARAVHASASVLPPAARARSPSDPSRTTDAPTRHGSARVGVELGRELPPGARSLPPANGCAL